MAAARNRSPWPRRILIGVAALLALDAVLLAAAAGNPAVREGARRFRPTLGALLTAATSKSVAMLAPARTHRGACSSAAAHRAPRALRVAIATASVAPAAPAGFAFALCASGQEEAFRYLYAVPSEGSHGWQMSGSYDERRLGELQRERRPFVWFSDEDGEYLVTDAGIVRQAERITRPVREQGAEMGRIGAQQGLIGAQQGRIGARQGAIGARIGALAAQQAAAAVSGDERRADELDARMQRIQRQLERESAAFEQQMQPLAREQERLGRIQSELGRRQEALVQEERRTMRELLVRAKRDGKAVRLHVEA
jgi:hypothetical protein